MRLRGIYFFSRSHAKADSSREAVRNDRFGVPHDSISLSFRDALARNLLFLTRSQAKADSSDEAVQNDRFGVPHDTISLSFRDALARNLLFLTRSQTRADSSREAVRNDRFGAQHDTISLSFRDAFARNLLFRKRSQTTTVSSCKAVRNDRFGVATVLVHDRCARCAPCGVHRWANSSIGGAFKALSAGRAGQCLTYANYLLVCASCGPNTKVHNVGHRRELHRASAACSLNC